MYKVCGYVNYECTFDEEKVFGNHLDLKDAITLFWIVARKNDSLNFMRLDTMIDSLANEQEWDEEDYYANSYGGTIVVYEESTSDKDCDREIVLIRVERDAITKTNSYKGIEYSQQITADEKEIIEQMREVDVMACCYSEKEDASIGFGTSYDAATESIDQLDTEWIDNGLHDSFWENHQEFEQGVEKARRFSTEHPDVTIYQALFEVFGDFAISYTANEVEVDLQLDFDVNKAMYDLLMEL